MFFPLTPTYLPAAGLGGWVGGSDYSTVLLVPKGEERRGQTFSHGSMIILLLAIVDSEKQQQQQQQQQQLRWRVTT
jgi:hypothetical protein